VKSAVEAAARSFALAGAIVEPMQPFLTRQMLDGLDQFWRMRFWSDFVDMAPERRAKILPYICEWVEPAAKLSGVEVYRGFGRIPEMAAATNVALQKYDFVLSPTAPMPAYAAELASPIHDPQRPFEHIGFTVAFNMSGHPAGSVNCGHTSAGLPIGLQIIGRRFDDLGVLQLAHAFEKMRPAPRPWPEP